MSKGQDVWVLHFNDLRPSGEFGHGWSLLFSSREVALRFVAIEWKSCAVQWDTPVGGRQEKYVRGTDRKGNWYVLALRRVDEEVAPLENEA